MKITENALNILTINSYKGVGRAWITKNLKGNESAELIIDIFNQNSKSDFKIDINDFEQHKNIVKEYIQKISSCTDGAVSIGDEDFPKYEGTVKNSEQPVVLFYCGDIKLLNNSNNIAVIGLLKPDERIKEIEQSVVKTLVSKGATIVSGLALGCDSIAHRQALQSKGKTIAILPNTLNNILPTANKTLADEIVASGGLLITEYYKDFSTKMELTSRYTERDRLQAMFSNCVVLSASYAKNALGYDSGSRLAMGYALNYSIQRAVIYNSEYGSDSQFDLNRQCINEDKNIIIINNENFEGAISKIVNTKSNFNRRQQSLF